MIETPENAISGIDATLVREFKNIYGDSALLCRYRPCPRGSVGFSRVRDRDRHESSHTRKFRCEDAACEFHDSGFSTKSALQKHTQMYHRKIDEIVLPIRRRPRATSLRERFLDPNDSSSRSDPYRRKLSQLDPQKLRPIKELGTSFRSPPQGFASSEFRMHDEQAVYAVNFDAYQNIRSADATLHFEEPQDSLFGGKKIGLSDYKERQLKKGDLRQAQRLPTTSSHILYNANTQNASLVQPANKLKRASNNDFAETPNPNTQQNARARAQQIQGQQSQIPKQFPQQDYLLLTPAQIAVLTPKDRKEYEQSRIVQDKIDIEKLKSIMQEEAQITRLSPDLPMDQETKLNMIKMLRELHRPLINMSKVILKWYQISRDDARARIFFRLVSRNILYSEKLAI